MPPIAPSNNGHASAPTPNPLANGREPILAKSDDRILTICIVPWNRMREGLAQHPLLDPRSPPCSEGPHNTQPTPERLPTLLHLLARPPASRWAGQAVSA